MTISILPEYRLLLDAAAPLPTPRVDPTPWTPERWREALRIAEWHRLAPALYAHLAALRSGSGTPASPPDVARSLEAAYLENAARCLYVSSAAADVLAALQSAGVPAMVLKGAALIETVYPDPAIREMLDLDVLVAPDRMSEAASALAPLGYRPHLGEPNEGADARLVAQHHDAALVGSEELLAVELHRHIALAGEAHGFSMTDLWHRARPSARGEYRLPSAEDLLLHVCLHFTRNRLGGSYRRMQTGGALAQIGDVARIVAAESLDWDALAGRARTYRTATAVFLALFAAARLGVPVPAEPLRSLRPARFDEPLGERLVSLRVLRTGTHLPVRDTRWMLMPSREALRRGWGADPSRPLSFARAYLARALAQLPRLRSELRRPDRVLQDQRLNRQIFSLQDNR